MMNESTRISKGKKDANLSRAELQTLTTTVQLDRIAYQYIIIIIRITVLAVYTRLRISQGHFMLTLAGIRWVL